MNKYLIAAIAILTGVSSAFGWFLYNQIQENGMLSKELQDMAGELEAQKLAAKLDQQEARDNYEASSRSCQNAIRSAVEAVRLKPIEVPRYVENGDPNPLCPAISLRDAQNSGVGPFVPARPDSKD
jgi:type II secretory pathway pseudopilin PulG